MKYLFPLALSPVMLTGCALTSSLPPPEPADQVVDQLIEAQVPVIAQAWETLRRARGQHEPRATPATLATPAQPLTSGPSPHKILSTPQSTGSRPATLPLVPGGSARTLRQAVTRIAPVGWKQHYAQGLKPEVKHAIRWRGNDQWPYVLNKMLHEEHLEAAIDWKTHRVSITGQAGAKPPVKPAKPASDKKPFVATPVAAKPVPVLTTWQAAAGSTLRDTLSIWSAREKCPAPGIENWTVHWLTAVNYRIDAPLTFTGSYEAMLNSVFTLYGSAQTPLYAGVRRAQCILTVDDKKPQ